MKNDLITLADCLKSTVNTLNIVTSNICNSLQTGQLTPSQLKSHILAK